MYRKPTESIGVADDIMPGGGGGLGPMPGRGGRGGRGAGGFGGFGRGGRGGRGVRLPLGSRSSQPGLLRLSQMAGGAQGGLGGFQPMGGADFI